MIIGTLTLLMLLFGGGGSLENYLLNIKKPVKAAVENKDTVKEVISLSKELQKQLKVQNQEITDLRENFLDLHTSHDATLADSEACLDRLASARDTGQKHILDARKAMKDLMTQEEWTTVFAEKDD